MNCKLGRLVRQRGSCPPSGAEPPSALGVRRIDLKCVQCWNPWWRGMNAHCPFPDLPDEKVRKCAAPDSDMSLEQQHERR